MTNLTLFRAVIFCLVFIVMPMLICAQTQPAAPAAPSAPAKPAEPAQAVKPTPEAKPGDVDTVEHLLAAVYDVISGAKSQPRDWDRFRSLFYPGMARMISSGRNPTGNIIVRSSTPEEYVTRATSFFDTDGFYESSVANRIELWDHMAEAWSSYEGRHEKGGVPFARGINNFQFVHDGKRWWVLTIYWEGEDPTHPIPEKYLK